MAGLTVEESDKAKLIRLVAFLEALTPSSEVSEVCKAALSDAKTAIKAHGQKFEQGAAERDE